MPAAKRLYSSGLFYKDLDGDGKLDVYRFMISNDVLVNSVVFSEKDGQVVTDTNNKAYQKVFVNSEMGKRMIRISLEEKNLLPMDYWDYPDPEDE